MAVSSEMSIEVMSDPTNPLRVAALYDIHGNIPALEAVLAEVVAGAADSFVVGGDVAAGPFPPETIERLMQLELPARFVMGNADRELIDSFERGPHADEIADPSTRWCAEQLSERHVDFLRSFEPTVTLEVADLGRVLFCHGSPRSDEELITPATPAPRIERMLDGVDANVVVCGHTHMQFDRVILGTRVVNAGSVGMPYELAPGSYWALLGDRVEHRHTGYDLQAAAAMIRRSGWPPADEYARDNVLTVPPPEEVIPVFESRAQQREIEDA
jgi:predicted phosphodiesterase